MRFWNLMRWPTENLLRFGNLMRTSQDFCYVFGQNIARYLELPITLRGFLQISHEKTARFSFLVRDWALFSYKTSRFPTMFLAVFSWGIREVCSYREGQTGQLRLWAFRDCGQLEITGIQVTCLFQIYCSTLTTSLPPAGSDAYTVYVCNHIFDPN